MDHIPAVETTLQALKDKLGFVPQLLGDMADCSPSAFLGYVQLDSLINEYSSLTEDERTVILFYVAALNKCSYCQSVHKKEASNKGIQMGELAALRCGQEPSSPSLKLLTQFTYDLWLNRGQISPEQQANYEAKGLSKSKMVDIVTLFTLKTLSNYSHSIIKCAIDPQFKD